MTVFSAMVVLERRGGGYAMVPSRDVEMSEHTLYDSAHDSTSEVRCCTNAAAA